MWDLAIKIEKWRWCMGATGGCRGQRITGMKRTGTGFGRERQHQCRSSVPTRRSGCTVSLHRAASLPQAQTSTHTQPPLIMPLHPIQQCLPTIALLPVTPTANPMSSQDHNLWKASTHLKA